VRAEHQAMQREEVTCESHKMIGGIQLDKWERERPRPPPKLTKEIRNQFFRISREPGLLVNGYVLWSVEAAKWSVLDTSSVSAEKTRIDAVLRRRDPEVFTQMCNANLSDEHDLPVLATTARLLRSLVTWWDLAGTETVHDCMEM
jgi:hypothetical protein